MRTQITARNFNASPSLREYATEQLERLERYYDGITDARMTLIYENHGTIEKTAEVTLNVFRQQLAAHETGSTHEEAIDRCVKNLQRQIKKYKAKLRSVDKDIVR